ncbi:MAG: hypothetical protein OEN50_13540, partial [Deltaproteobacteria bacterium]|nr:hypothetical protein [Deltaproteobacteria bacterium]
MFFTMRKVAALAIMILTLPCIAMAAEENIYSGKTLRFIVGSSAGGGYDTYTRLIARHIGRFIPGNPSSIVENMPGAGGLIAANYVYKRADADGLVVGIFNNSNIVRKGLGDPRVNID